MSKSKSRARYLLAFVAAAILALAMAVPAFAADPAKGDDKTITIKTPAGIDADATNTYTIYKVFDAVASEDGISYKLMSSANGAVPDGFTVDAAGNVYIGTPVDTKPATGDYIAIVMPGGATKYIEQPAADAKLTDTQIAAIAAYAKKVQVATVDIKGPEAEKTVALSDFGYYYITTSTGTVVTIDSTNLSAEVIDKNTVPTVVKEITDANSFDDAGKKALAQLGSDVEYTATITVGKGAKGYVFHDKMGAGLTFKEVKSVVINDADKLPAGSTTSDFYTVKSTADDGDTLTITFTDGIKEGAEITIVYVGTVNSDALTIVTGKNTCYVSYGDENSNNKTPEDSTNVYNAKLDVTKTNGKDEPLAGAGFVVKNASGAYYKYTAAAGGSEATVSWYTLATGETLERAIAAGKVTEQKTTTGEGGNVVSFTGLANGTYTLVESTVPDGYNKAADKQFTIAEADANLTQAAAGVAGSSANVAETVVNNSGAELPSTGGMGTTILYIIGGILVLGAVVYLITKRRMAKTNIKSDDLM